MRESKLLLIAAIAEIVSAVAIVLTVVYAVSELQQSQARGNTDIENVLYARMMELDRLIVESPDMADLLLRAKEDPASLGPQERARYLAYEHIFYDSWEAALQAWRNGLMTDRSFESWNQWFIEDSARRSKLGWTGNQRYYDEEFISYVEERVSWP